MKKICIGIACLTLITAVVTRQANAQSAAPDSLSANGSATTTVEQTPEMWLYQQETQRYDSPKQAVRRKAEFVSQQRQLRLASMRWYGMSNSRPTVNPTPWMGMYSPAWVSGRGYSFGWPRYARSSTIIIER